MKTTSLTLAVLAVLASHALAGPLKEAKINRIVNDVKVIEPRTGARPAAIEEMIKNDLGVATGVQSRAELLFQDNTLTRLGAETFFSFQPGTRNINLDRGSMLLQVPKNLGGARIRAASVSASITGTTIMVEHLAGKKVKLTVLEGSLRVGLENRPRASLMLTAGKMVIIPPDAKELPKSVDVNLRKLVQTSALIDPQVFKGESKTAVAALPSMPLIEQEIAHQEAATNAPQATVTADAAGSAAFATQSSLLSSGTLPTSKAKTDTPLPSTDTETTTPDTDSTADSTAAATAPATAPATAGTTAGTTVSNLEAPTIALSGDIALASGVTGSIKSTTGNITGATFSLTGFDSVESAGKITVFNLDTRDLKAGGNVTVNGDLHVTTADVGGWFWTAGTISPRVGEAATTITVLKAESIQAVGGMNFKGASGSLTTTPSAGGLVTMEVTEAIFSTATGNGINGANFDGGDALPASLHEGGDGGTLNVGTALKPVTGKIEVRQPITATTGVNASGVATGGRGGTVNLIATDTISIDSTVKVSDSATGRASKQGGTIRVDSRRTLGTAISVTSSGQLLSLLAAAAPGPGGKVEFVSAGGDILVNGGTVQADNGTVDIRNNGAGKVEITNANIRGDVVKIGALGANGQLRIGGGTISADTSLKLYGGTSNGEVRFTDNTTLGGAGMKIIAGKTVTIDNGKTVTIGGSTAANVHTDNPNYTGSGGNGSTSGAFGGNGATTQGYSSRPAF